MKNNGKQYIFYSLRASDPWEAFKIEQLVTVMSVLWSSEDLCFPDK